MLQRIQTAFWVLSIVTVVFFVWQSSGKPVMSAEIYVLAVLALVSNTLSIFSYMKRRRQLRFSYLGILSSMVIIALIAWQYKSQEWLSLILLSSSVLMNILANYFTKKDIKLVEESSRLR